MNTVETPSSSVAKIAWTAGIVIFAMGLLAILGAVLNHDNRSGQAIAVGFVGILLGIFLFVGGSIVDRLSRIEKHLRPATITEEIQRSPLEVFKTRLSVSNVKMKYWYENIVDVFTPRSP